MFLRHHIADYFASDDALDECVRLRVLVPSCKYDDCNLLWTVWIGIPSCSSDDREFAVRHKLDFVDVYDADKKHILNSEQVCVCKIMLISFRQIDSKLAI